MTISIRTIDISALDIAQSTCNELIDQAQDWSDKTFDNQYREAILTLVEGVVLLIGYLAGFLYSWLRLQVVKTHRYWLARTVQAVPVLNGWWSAPSVLLELVTYAERCWQAITPTVNTDILDYELSYAFAAEAVPVALQ